ncbi:ssDNA binding protein [Gordonia phage Octobien14]|uniref:SsDNA binding protein n=1 Tax=Gordonia phage Octobien14 TaxID=2483673 RepID=A0A3G3MA07_9CAUD|nr:ssDNA binding protein [Gordonia phage Octobien14]AYR03223.1 ssDNA binding protein [Gordonia phage Octobien14]
MAMPTISGSNATVFGGKDQELKYDVGQYGAYVLFNLGMQKAKKDQYGEWETTAKTTIKAAAYGELAEFIKDNIQHLDKVDFTAEMTGVDLWEGKDGTQANIQVKILTIGAPFRKKEDSGY